ncbi:MAG: DUF5615 family PIN-like protein [Dehalococcoidia bacterium]
MLLSFEPRGNRRGGDRGGRGVLAERGRGPHPLAGRVSFPLYFDDDSRVRAVLTALRAEGVDVQTSTEAGLEASPDSVHLAHAAASGRALATRDEVDFRRLHQESIDTGLHHAGIVLIQQRWRLSVGEEIRRIRQLQQSFSTPDMVDRMEDLTGRS